MFFLIPQLIDANWQMVQRQLAEFDYLFDADTHEKIAVFRFRSRCWHYAIKATLN